MNEVQGVVMDQEGKVVHRLFGKWHEGLYCGVAPSAKCIWRPGEAGPESWGRREGNVGALADLFTIQRPAVIHTKAVEDGPSA